MGLLRALAPGLEVTRMLERVGRAELLRDDVLRLLERALGDVERVGAHIGDETDRRGRPERCPLVELLGQDHGPLQRVTVPPPCIPLQRGGPVTYPCRPLRF